MYNSELIHIMKKIYAKYNKIITMQKWKNGEYSCTKKLNNKYQIVRDETNLLMKFRTTI